MQTTLKVHSHVTKPTKSVVTIIMYVQTSVNDGQVVVVVASSKFYF